MIYSLIIGLASCTLRELAKGTGIYVGAALNSIHISNDGEYAAKGAEEYSLITAENGCKMNYIAKSFDEIDPTRCNSMVEFAQNHSQQIRGHTLVWAAPGTHNPSFVNDEKNTTKLEEFMLRYINETITRVGDYVFAWDVVNEAVTNDINANGTYIKTSPWSSIDDFICKAYKAARKANPKAKLFYNDYKHASMTGDQKTKSDRVYHLISLMKERGEDCPIDGVGFQNHIDINYNESDFEGVKQNIKRYDRIGVEVHFTETDVGCNKTGERICNMTDWPQEAIDKQGRLFGQMLLICLNEPNCMNFETWGFTDKYGVDGENQKPLPFDKDFKPKKAYQDMVYQLKHFNKSSEIALEKLAQGNGEPLDLVFIQ